MEGTGGTRRWKGHDGRGGGGVPVTRRSKRLPIVGQQTRLQVRFPDIDMVIHRHAVLMLHRPEDLHTDCRQ